MRLRKTLVSAPILAFPDCSRMFILDTDASNQGIGAVLSQEHDDGLEHVVAYASRALSKAERKYSVTRKELLAVVSFLHHFRPNLLGRRFKLRTDHSSLLWLRSFKEPEGQLARWLEQLEEYDFDTEHRQGRLHGNADALSRLAVCEGGAICDVSTDSVMSAVANTSILPVYPSAVANTSILPVYSSQEIRVKQLQDHLVGPFLRAKENGDQAPSDKTGPKWHKMVQLWDQLFVKDGALYRQCRVADDYSNVIQLVVPDSLKEEVMYGVHEGIGGGHLGVEKSVVKLKERFYWPGHYNDIKSWCANCRNCIARKTAPPHRRAPLQPVRVGYPMEMVAVDILGPFPKNESGNCYILVAEDYFTKWLEVWAIPNQEAKTIAQKFLEEMFLRFSLPSRLHSDQGRQFEGKLIEELCRLLQVEKTRTIPYHPQGDGLVERANRTILSMLATVVKNHKDWESHLRATCMAYNTSIQSTTGQSPFFLMFGRRARIPVDLLCGPGGAGEYMSINNYVSQQIKILQAAYHQVHTRMGLQQDRQKEIYDRKRHGEPFKVGDSVMLYTPFIPRGRCKKLHCPWSGPYVILKKLSEVTYRIQRCHSRRQRMVVHFNRLKLCPADVRSPSRCLENTPHGQDGNVTSPPVNSKSSGLGQKHSPVILVPDVDEMEYNGVDNLVTDMDDMERSAANEGVSPTGSATTGETSNTMTEEISTARRYPHREHHPPSRYDDFVRI